MYIPLHCPDSRVNNSNKSFLTSLSINFINMSDVGEPIGNNIRTVITNNNTNFKLLKFTG